MKKLAAVLLSVILLLSLVGCGSKAVSADPNVGKYVASKAEVLGFEVAVKDVFEKGFTIELLDRGKCTLEIDGAKSNGKWSIKDDVLHIEGVGVKSEGTLSSGVMKLENVLGTGMKLTFQKEGGQSVAAQGDYDYYVLESFDGGEGLRASGSELEMYGMSDWYVLLRGDGTAEIMFDIRETGTWKKGQIILEGIGTMEYKEEKDTISIDMDGTVFVFALNDGLPPPPTASTAQSLEEALGVEQLGFVSPTTEFEIGSYWYGALMISDFSPSSQAAEAEGIYDVWGYIEEDSSGRAFFEVFDTMDMEYDPIYSLYVNLYGDYMEADIGEDDAWIFDIYLDESEEWWLSTVLDNGVLYIDYFCRGENISFNFLLYMREDGTYWDEQNDYILPPGYDDYKGGLDVAYGPTPPVTADNSGSLSGAWVDMSTVIDDVLISASVPEGTWYCKPYMDTYSLYNVPSEDKVYSSSPKIAIRITSNVERFDFYKDDFENLKSIDDRTIAGIKMAGRTYKSVGMEWTEYIGVIDSDHAVSVLITKLDISPGSEADMVLDSISFD